MGSARTRGRCDHRPGRYGRAAVIALLLAGCGEPRAPEPADAEPPLTAATLGTQDVRSVAEYLQESPYAEADVELGDRLLMQCRACHTLKAGEPHMLGPNLHGVFGRQAGTVREFGYTNALLQADFVWTPRALDAWLRQPSRFLPGNAMAYGGLRYAEDRAALIASLMRQTSAMPLDGKEQQ